MLTNLSLLITAVLTFFLGLLVYINNPQKPSNRNFFYFTSSLSLWTITNLMANISADPSLALFWSRAAIVGAALLIYYFLLFSMTFTSDKQVGSWLRFILFIPAFIIILFSPTAANVVSSNAYGQQIQTGWLYIFVIAYLPIYTIWGVVLFIKAQRSSTGQRKNQIKSILVGTALIAVPGIIFNAIFPVIGVTGLSEFGPIFTLLLVAMIAYSILRHQLMDIRFIVTRSVAFATSIFIIAAVFGLVSFQIVAVILPADASQTTIRLSYTLIAVLLAFAFNPLVRFFEKITSKLFFRGQYDPQKLTNQIGDILSSEIDLDKLSTRVLNEITSQMKINISEIVVFSKDRVFYEKIPLKNTQKEISHKELQKLGRVTLIVENLKPGERRDILKEFGFSLSIPLRTSEKFIGYMLLGEKKNGEIFGTQDLAVLKSIANEVSVAMANALSYKEIQLFTETLSEKVRQRTAQLNAANSQLRELDQAKDEFISMASHQLRTPLTTVKGYASMLEEGDFGKLTKQQKDTVSLTLDGANRMAHLIDDLLNVSRMDANRFFLEVEPVDIGGLVEQELKQLEVMAKTKNVKIKYSAPKSKIPLIRLDETKTRQVVMNLVDNAIHYSKPEGGEVLVNLGLEGKNVVFEVRDNGIGVPVSEQSKLFSKMFRAQNAQQVRPDGTGLGLYMVKRVITDQAGSIIFESQEGRGSIFGFKLPLGGVPKSAEEASKKISEKVTLQNKKK